MPVQYVPRVIVKFKDALIDPLVNDAADLFLAQFIAGTITGTNWPQLLAQPQFQGITIEKLLKAVSQTELVNLMNLAFRRDPSYRFFAPNFLTYFIIPCPASVNPETVALALSPWGPVEKAYVAEAPSDPPAVNPGQNPAWYQVDTGYMRLAPAGIGAEYAWGQSGGDGGKPAIQLQFIDIESDWELTHPDLPKNNANQPLIQHVYGYRYGTALAKNHGTGVLGIVMASDSNPAAPYDQSSLGITPNVAVPLVASYWRNKNTTDHFNTILAAIVRLSLGDVLLLETQVNLEYPVGNIILANLPVEYFQHLFHVIRLGTALGIVIVEAAGNRYHDLGNLGVYSVAWLNRTDPQFEDSGAIMVSAATPWTHGGSSTQPPNYVHAPIVTNTTRQHNFGNRIDCYAWGDNIYTTKVDAQNNYIYGNFGDTSGASAIIAGAALSVQGMAEANLGYRLSPLQMRNVLSDTTTGTASQNPAQDKLGVMPDLRAIMANTLGIIPDVYIRDFVGDIGDPHTGPISSSPDIILRRNPVSDPQGEFGETNIANKDNAWLSEEAITGRTHYIYVRVRNRNTVAAANVTATVYWSEPATLVTPDSWNHIGQTGSANVPPNDVLTVLPHLTWLNAPDPGTYCFVVLIGSPPDPVPLKPADFLNWPAVNAWVLYRRFIRENNNVTWRNFKVVNITPQTSGTFVVLDFLVRGTWSQAAPMSLEVLSQLPTEVQLWMQVPDKDWKVLSALRELGQVIPVEKLLSDLREHGVVIPDKMEETKKSLAIRLNPHGRSRTREIMFPPKFESRCQFLVFVPKQFRKDPRELSIRQYSQNQEIGRMTWRLVPKAKSKKP